MKIEKILDEKHHKVYCFTTYLKVFMQEWLGSEDNDAVLRVRYDRNPEVTDKFYLREAER